MTFAEVDRGDVVGIPKQHHGGRAVGFLLARLRAVIVADGAVGVEIGEEEGVGV